MYLNSSEDPNTGTPFSSLSIIITKLSTLQITQMNSAAFSSILISPSELQLIKNAVLIDTRPPDAYAAGHIEGAVNIHDVFTYLATTTSAGIAAFKDKFSKLFGAAGLSGTEIAIVYEDQMDTGFGQSCRGYVFLRYLGYPEEKIRILNGGIMAWINEGKPVTTDVSKPTSKAFPLSTSGHEILVDVEEMKQIVRSMQDKFQDQENPQKTVILDTRDAEEWDCISSSPYGRDFCPRKGRIPGAVWIEWRRMMEETAAGARLKGSEGVMQECARVNIKPDSNVVVYCFKGARASNTLVGLQEAGIKNVRLYMGSWNEWSRDTSLPITAE
jgi:thiosulfate/3-mercaptopyruvate sulfurtransferase